MTRKQREVADRHDLFLTIAREMMHREGFHHMSMDRVAESAEFSKGTIYQHFSCKEEMLIQLCIRSLTRLLNLGHLAERFDGNHRERLLAFSFAHDIWQRYEPNDIGMMHNLHTDGVMQKVSPESRMQHDALELGIVNLVGGIVQCAKDAGDLPDNSLNAPEIVFGIWSMYHGGQLLRSYDFPLSRFGIHNPGGTITTMTQVALNGLGWTPLMDEAATNALLDTFQNNYFKDEIDVLSERKLLNA